jgi:hypothetical protein
VQTLREALDLARDLPATPQGNLEVRRVLKLTSASIRGILGDSGFMGAMQRAAWEHSSTLGLLVDRRLRFVGSATFVSFGGRHFVLTAAHVWQVLRAAESFALKYDDGPQVLAMGRTQVRVRSLPELIPEFSPHGDNGWTLEGPDLALLELPSSSVEIVERTKKFYRLEDRPPNEPSAAGVGVWGIMGVPAEMTWTGPTYRVFTAGLYDSFVVRRSVGTGIDYVDMSYDRFDEPDQPRYYSGVSGGGLWHAAIGQGGCWPGECVPSLEGVAYWQRRSHPTKGFIRCHGRQTLEQLLC